MIESMLKNKMDHSQPRPLTWARVHTGSLLPLEYGVWRMIKSMLKNMMEESMVARIIEKDASYNFIQSFSNFS